MPADGVPDGGGQRARLAAALLVVLPDRDDRGLRGEADEAGALAGAGGDDPGDLGAVADRVVGAVGARALLRGRVLVLGQQVEAGGPVDGPRQLRVVGVDPGVDDRDPDALALGVLPQPVEDDPLQGPWHARYLLLHREGALAAAGE
ncbi:hypothetical protein GCM10020221_22130 [Streptomyces thioluteus]|uniref:Uncharacterized protein n=1 Tax=Streptomyces thioluteus TaxID=66431 RepID=A0ABP6J8Z3_STRTU